jgi:hypothetical protein
MPRENIEAVFQATWQGNYDSAAPDQTDGLLPAECPAEVDYAAFTDLVRQVPLLVEVFISPSKENLAGHLEDISDKKLDDIAYGLRLMALGKG